MQFKNPVFKNILIIGIVSLLFALIYGSWYSIIINIPIGIVFSVLCYLTGRVVSSIILHFIGNGFFNIFVMIISNKIIELQPFQALIGFFLTLIISSIMFVLLFRRFLKRE